MARKLRLIFSLILLLSCSPVWATDYTQDVNAQACYLFETGSGTNADDATSNNNDGTFVSSGHPAWFNTSTPDIWSTYAVDFTPDDYISLPTLGIFGGATDFSVCVYVYTDSTSGYNYIWHPRGERDVIMHTLNGKPVFGYYAGGENYVTALNALSTTAWNHICGVWNKTVDNKEYLFVNGVSVGTPLACGTPAAVTDTSTLGTQFYSGVPHVSWNGRMDDTGIFNRILSSTEINDIMDNGLKPAVTRHEMFMVM